MLFKIPLSEIWQQVNTRTFFKNNRNVRMLVQHTNDANPPVQDDGITINAYDTFQIPDDGYQYWCKMLHGVGEIIVNPTYIVSGGSTPDNTVLDSGSDVFAGNPLYIEITLSEIPTGSFQAVITAVGDESQVAKVGGITVTYPEAGKFRVYNSGISGITFNWLALQG